MVAGSPTLIVRKVRFAYPDDMPARWNTRVPEAAIAANAVSLLMPYVEPYVVSSVRRALPTLPPELRDATESYLRQEQQHHVQHRRLNEIVAAQYRGVTTIEKWMRRTYRRLSHRHGERFNLAFAAGFETVAFASARWFESHRRELFDGADPVPASLFLWHLAEEVEHKSIAHDAYVARGGGRLMYAFAMLLSLIILGWFTVLGVFVMLVGERRVLNPLAWWRLIKWAITLAFEILPTMAASVLPSHHPSQLVDPLWLQSWLAEFVQPANRG